MKRIFVLSVVLAAGVPNVDALDDRALLMVMKLSERPTYAWTTSIEDDAGSYLIQGQTTAEGFSWVRMPPPKPLARRLGRDAEGDVDVLFHGPQRFVLRTTSGWKTLAEIPRERARWDEPVVWSPRAQARSTVPTDPLGIPVVMLQGPDEDDRAYSNHQLALGLPHEELAVIASSAAELRLEGNTIEGTLTDLGAQLLLVREGQEHLIALAAAGVFKLQTAAGMVTRYSLRLEGVLLVKDKKVLVHQSMQTVIRNVGTATVTVDEEARRKLIP